jgi:hypothetical protein
MTANILLIGGSLNQTTMMHRISEYLSAYSCYFTPFYADGLIGNLSKAGVLNASILGGRHRADTMAYLQDHRLSLDVGGKLRTYDMVITSTDLVVQRNIRDKRLVLVQEGITEPEGWAYRMVKRLKPLRFLANTAATGLSDAYDVFCVASPGYRDLFIRKGVRPEKMAVTGIPNFDQIQAFLDNDFPYRDYVLAATSPLRESLRRDDRISFIRNACRIAAGRQAWSKRMPFEVRIMIQKFNASRDRVIN